MSEKLRIFLQKQDIIIQSERNKVLRDLDLVENGKPIQISDEEWNELQLKLRLVSEA